jgi:hypothetical protein
VNYISARPADSKGNEIESPGDLQVIVMKKQLIVGFLFSATALAGCGRPEIAQRDPTTVSAESLKSDTELAVETLDRMLEMAGNGVWDAVVDQYYGEQHKFRTSADRDKLVQRLSEKWGEKFVEGLGRATKLPAQIEGDKAVFQDGDVTVFILHRSESGDWKFHL